MAPFAPCSARQLRPRKHQWTHWVRLLLMWAARVCLAYSGTLLDRALSLMESNKRMPEDVALRIFSGVLEGVKQFHLHDPAWAHRDIKPVRTQPWQIRDTVKGRGRGASFDALCVYRFACCIMQSALVAGEFGADF